MSRQQYQALDDAILDRLARNLASMRLGHLSCGKVHEESMRLESLTGRKAFRIIDGRLQALRRAGKIRFNSLGGWHRLDAA